MRVVGTFRKATSAYQWIIYAQKELIFDLFSTSLLEGISAVKRSNNEAPRRYNSSEGFPTRRLWPLRSLVMAEVQGPGQCLASGCLQQKADQFRQRPAFLVGPLLKPAVQLPAGRKSIRCGRRCSRCTAGWCNAAEPVGGR